MEVVLKVRKKGVVILPKGLRDALGIGEVDELVAEVVDGKLVMRPKVVDATWDLSRGSSARSTSWRPAGTRG